MSVYKSELVAAGYEGSPEEFRAILSETLASLFPDRSCEDVCQHPDDADTFCDAIQFRVRNWNLDDYLILSMLVNARKKGELPSVPYKPRPTLTRQLGSYCCYMQEQEFVDFLDQVLEDGYSPPFTDESICFRPRVARGYCRKVRELIGCMKLPDDFILRTLNNARKMSSIAKSGGSNA